MAQKFETNLSRGSVTKNLILFSLPFMLSNLIQTMYNTADMIIVGNFTGTACLNGVNIGAQIAFVITNMVMGLCVGGTVLIAQYLTAHRTEELKDTIGTLFTSIMAIAVLLTVLSIAVRKPLIALFSDDEAVLKYAEDYFLVTSIGNIFIFAYNALAAIMRGLGDSKRPLIFVTIACVINIGLDLLMVGAWGWGAEGAGIATVISQAISSILCIIYLRRSNFVFDFRLKSLGFKMHSLKMIMRIGIPTSIQNVATGVSFLFITAMANGISMVAGSAVGVVGKLNGFSIMPAVAMASSISAVSAQNIGAGEIGRAKKTMRIGMVIALAFSLVALAIFQAIPDKLMGLFVNSSDPDMEALIQAGTDYIRVFSLEYSIIPIMFSLNGLFIGSGHTLFSLITNIISAIALRIPVAALGMNLSDNALQGLAIAAPTATLFSLIICIIFYLTGKWKKMVIIKDAKIID